MVHGDINNDNRSAKKNHELPNTGFRWTYRKRSSRNTNRRLRLRQCVSSKYISLTTIIPTILLFPSVDFQTFPARDMLFVAREFAE